MRKRNILILWYEISLTLFEGMQNRRILFIRDFGILVPSWIDTGLLIKLRAIKQHILWKKKISVKNLERAKPSHCEQGRNWHQQWRKSWWVGWVCLICKVTLEISRFDLRSLPEARWLKQFLKIALKRITMS